MKWSMLLLSVLACAAEPSGPGLSDEQFIDTMVELRRAAMVAGTDTARFMELRATILESQGVTEEELRGYVATRSRNLEHMAEVWDSIGSRLTVPELQ